MFFIGMNCALVFAPHAPPRLKHSVFEQFRGFLLAFFGCFEVYRSFQGRIGCFQGDLRLVNAFSRSDKLLFAAGFHFYTLLFFLAGRDRRPAVAFSPSRSFFCMESINPSGFCSPDCAAAIATDCRIVAPSPMVSIKCRVVVFVLQNRPIPFV